MFSISFPGMSLKRPSADPRTFPACICIPHRWRRIRWMVHGRCCCCLPHPHPHPPCILSCFCVCRHPVRFRTKPKVMRGPLVRLSQFRAVFWAARRRPVMYGGPGGLWHMPVEVCVDVYSYMHAFCLLLAHTHRRSSVFGIGNLFHLAAAPTRLRFC